MKRMIRNASRVTTWFLALACGAASSAGASTLAFWQLNEFGSGFIDPTVSAFSTTNLANIGQNPAIDSSGHSNRDMLRAHPTGDPGYPYNSDLQANGTTRNAASYVTIPLAGSVEGSDLRGYNGSSENGILTTRVPDAFTRSDLLGGFTYEIAFKPNNDVFQGSNPANGFKDNGRFYLTSIEGRIAILMEDSNSATGVVAPVIVFDMFTTDSSTRVRLSAPYTPNVNTYVHVAGVFDPAKAVDGINDTYLYINKGLITKGLATTVFNIDLSNGGSANFTAIGGTTSASNIMQSFSTIDAVKISNTALTPTFFFIPEPSSAALIVIGAMCFGWNRQRPRLEMRPSGPADKR